VSESDGGKGVDGDRRGWWRPKGKGERKKEKEKTTEKEKKRKKREQMRKSYFIRLKIILLNYCKVETKKREEMVVPNG